MSGTNRDLDPRAPSFEMGASGMALPHRDGQKAIGAAVSGSSQPGSNKQNLTLISDEHWSQVNQQAYVSALAGHKPGLVDIERERQKLAQAGKLHIGTDARWSMRATAASADENRSHSKARDGGARLAGPTLGRRASDARLDYDFEDHHRGQFYKAHGRTSPAPAPKTHRRRGRRGAREEGNGNGDGAASAKGAGPASGNGQHNNSPWY